MKYLLLAITLSLFQVSSYAQQVDSIAIFSQTMKKQVCVVVITPATYSQTSISRFPVIYLLHGFGGSHRDWITRVPSVKYLANANQCIIVCADAENSWYLNSPSLPQSMYETFMSKELVKAIDSAYKTIPNAKHRAITGLSMGGHGALMLALKQPSVYGAAGSMSGGVNLRPFIKQFDLGKLIADTTAENFSWKNYSVLQMADSINTRQLKLIIDCGVDDFFMWANRELHQKLLQQKVAHEYIERPGSHNWSYWANALEYQFLFFRKYFYEKN